MTDSGTPVRFALLGYDPLLDPLLAEIISSEHRLVWVAAETDEIPDSLRVVAHQIERAGESSQWEGLLHGDVADVVLVGRGELTLREDQLRRLVQAKVGVVVAHPASMAPLFCYELDMITRENGCYLLPYYPGMDHAEVHRLAQLIGQSDPSTAKSAGPLGEIEQITFERPLAQRDQSTVLDQLARDTDLLITLCGTQTKVSALGTGEGPRAYAGLSVQFTGPNRVVTRWSVVPADESAAGKILVSGSKAQAELVLSGDPSDWKLQLQSTGEAAEIPSPPSSAEYDPAITLAEIVAGVHRSQDESSTEKQEQQRWFQACQSIDLLDAVQRSLIKGRTIELFFEDYTSESTFKGRMSAIGCSVLMLGLLTCMFGFVSDMFGGIYMDVVGKEMPGATRWWPGLLLAGLSLFLLIQVLPKFFPEKTDEE